MMHPSKASVLKANLLLVLLASAPVAILAFQNVRFQVNRANTAVRHQPSFNTPIGCRESHLKLAFQFDNQHARPSFLRRPKKMDKTLLSMSADDEESPPEDDDKTAKKVAGRKKRVLIGYRLSAVIYALLSIATLVPAFIKPNLAAMALNYAGGPVLAAGVAYILAGAAENDRLGSDTYKRLNLMLSKFGGAWLIAALLVSVTAQTSRGAKIVSNPLVMLGSFSAMVNGIKGWGYGAKGWDKSGDTSYVGDVVSIFKNSMGVFASSIPNATSGIYLVGTLFSAVLVVKKLLEIGEMLMGGADATAAKIAVRVLAFAKLKLLAGVTFTLMDAAKRDRLSGTTFIELNLLSTFVWLGMGAFLLNVGQAVSASLAAIMGCFSLLTGAQYYLKKKSG